MREQKYSISLKIWLDEIRRAIKGIYTRNPNFKMQKDLDGFLRSPYYERENIYKDWENFAKSWEEHLYDKADDTFNLIEKDIKSFEHDLEEISSKYTELTDLLVEQRELLPLEFLDKQSPHALGAVVGSPADIIYYANIYIKELQEKLNNEHK